MKIEVLGGGSEVGASCILCQMGESNILIDAGIRMGGKSDIGTPADSLPDLSRLSDIGGLDAILVTHAHLDHTGALPLVHQAFPKTPIYATAPTVQLMQVLLADALRIMTIKAEQEAEIPLYDPVTVGQMFTRVVPVNFGQGPVQLTPGISAEFFPAGHILGAALVGIRGPEGSLLVSGDFSRSDQRTVAGMTLPKFRPDVLVTESTYGNRLHANRAAEERRLIDTIARTIGRGGSVLIPAFALGRSQEVLLTLQHFQAQDMFPSVPIWVDGLVRSVCEVYANFPEYLMPSLRRRVEESGNPFYWKKGYIRAVGRASEREKLLKSGPCIIVASSGMLSGGPSQFYAFQMASDPRNAILLTGYQDEESPGKKLLEIAESGGGYFSYEGQSVEIVCEMNKYGLSAHADAAEIAAFVRALEPEAVLLVHGDEDARAKLAPMLSGLAVHLPDNGETFTYTSSRASSCWKAVAGNVAPGGGFQPGSQPGLRADSQPGSGRTGALSASSTGQGVSGSQGQGPGRSREPIVASGDLAKLWEKVAEQAKNRKIAARAYSVAELAQLWYGRDVATDRVERLQALLNEPNPYFSSDWKRPYLYRARPAAAVALEEKRRQRMQELAEFLVGKLILVKNPAGGVVPAICFSTGQSGFEAIKVGKSSTEHIPEDLVAVIGDWDMETPFDPGKEKTRLHAVNQQARLLRRMISLDSLLKVMLPATVVANGIPLEVEEKATEKVEKPAAEEAIDGKMQAYSLGEIAAALASGDEGIPARLADDGYTFHLAVAWRLALHPDVFSLVVDAGGKTLCSLQDVTLAREILAGKTSVSEEDEDRGDMEGDEVGEPLEMNQALAAVDQLLPPDTGLYRKGADVNSHTLLLYFNFPRVAAERYKREIDELSTLTGWQVKLNENPNQEALRRLALEVLPPGVKVKKGPSIRLVEEKVELKLEADPAQAVGRSVDGTGGLGSGMPDAIYREAIERFEAETGMRLVLNFADGSVLSSTAQGSASSSGDVGQGDKGKSAGDQHSHLILARGSEQPRSPMEINAAYNFIKDRFAHLGVEVYKTGKKYDPAVGKEYIEITFISPLIGEKHKETLRELARETGWPIRISPNPNQHAISDFLREVVPREWGPAASASFYPARGVWAITVTSLPEDDTEVAKIRERFNQYCGYELEFRT